MVEDTRDKERITNADERVFHLKEYESLRSEVLIWTSFFNSIVQYTSLACGAVYVFLLISEPKGIAHLPLTVAKAAWFLPFVISIVGALIANDASRSLLRLGQYLSRLEHGLGQGHYGWDSNLNRRRGTIPVIGLWGFWRWFWLLLIAGNLLAGIGVVFFCSKCFSSTIRSVSFFQI
jgi:hypothetical protein